ncbi:MAG TPA: hypothetical protein VK466_04145 [Terriglobales bacterium]|nr:hypothetical protein [Terriglobales bacterium]
MSALERAEVADPLQVSGEYDDRKGTDAVVFAEIEEVNTPVALLHTKDLSRDAARDADMLPGVGERNAIRRCAAQLVREEGEDCEGKESEKAAG